MKKVKCNLTPVTPRASTSQVLPESRAVDPVHTSLELQHAELEVNQESLALAKDSLTVSEQWLEVDCCRQDNNLPHESFVESNSRARMSYHNHP